MRILLGTVDVAGQITAYAEGFRRLGHQVTTVVSQRNPFYPEAQYDLEIGKTQIEWSWKANRSIQIAELLWLCATRGFVIRHDVCVFMWAGTSLLDFNSEYPVLKALGKRIVSIFNGDDVRHWSAYSQRMAPLIRTNACVPLEKLGSSYEEDPLSRPLYNIRMAERFSDVILSVPNQSGLAVRPYMHFFVPLDLSEYEMAIPGREIPVVVHAPSSTSVKGTEAILNTLERIRADGIAFELRLLQGMSNSQVKHELTDADIVIDQLHLPLHGKLGVEAMAAGCALVTCDRHDYEPFPPARPIWHIGPENLDEKLRHILTNRDLRIQLARDGRDHVERYHDNVRVAQRIMDHLQVIAGTRYDHYPTFFAREYQLPTGVEISPKLKRMTAEIIKRRGLPEGVDLRDMVKRGLMSADDIKSTQTIPRWRPAAQPVEA